MRFNKVELKLTALALASAFLAAECSLEAPNATAPDGGILTQSLNKTSYTFLAGSSPLFINMNTSSAQDGLITLSSNYDFDTSVLQEALTLCKLNAASWDYMSVEGTQVLTEGSEVPFTVSRSEANLTIYEARFDPPAAPDPEDPQDPGDVIQLHVDAAVLHDKAGRELDSNGNKIPGEAADDYYAVVYDVKGASPNTRNPWVPIPSPAFSIRTPSYDEEGKAWTADISFSFSLPGGSASASPDAAAALAQTLFANLSLQVSNDGNIYDFAASGTTLFAGLTAVINGVKCTYEVNDSPLIADKVYRLVLNIANITTDDYHYYGFAQSVDRGALNAGFEVYSDAVVVPPVESGTITLDSVLTGVRFTADYSGKNAVVYAVFDEDFIGKGAGLGGVSKGVARLVAEQGSYSFGRTQPGMDATISVDEYNQYYYWYNNKWTDVYGGSGTVTLYRQNPTDDSGYCYCYQSGADYYAAYTWYENSGSPQTVPLTVQDVEAQKGLDGYGAVNNVLKITLAPEVLLNFVHPPSGMISLNSVTLGVSPDVTITANAGTEYIFYGNGFLGNAYFPKDWSVEEDIIPSEY